MIEIALNAFATLFVTIDPIGLAPLFIALTQGMEQAERSRVALRACLIGAAILAVFGLAGDVILTTIGIGLPAFRIAGGLLLFLIAVEMLFEKRTERREKSAEADQPESAKSDPSVFPLATPLIAGPGALTLMILLMGEQQGSLQGQSVVLIVMLTVVISAYGLF